MALHMQRSINFANQISGQTSSSAIAEIPRCRVG